MTTPKIALATVLLLALAAPAHAGSPPNGLCPAGFDEMFNVNRPTSLRPSAHAPGGTPL